MYKLSVVALSVLSLFVIPSTIRLSIEDYSDEQFFLNISNYAMGKKPREIKDWFMLKTMIGSEDFQPSMTLLGRIMKVLLEKNTVGQTALSQDANINYVRLKKHLRFLEEKRFVETTVESGKINFTLSRMGREFAMMLSLLL